MKSFKNCHFSTDGGVGEKYRKREGCFCYFLLTNQQHVAVFKCKYMLFAI